MRKQNRKQKQNKNRNRKQKEKNTKPEKRDNGGSLNPAKHMEQDMVTQPVRKLANISSTDNRKRNT